MQIFEIWKRTNGTTSRFSSLLFSVVLLGGVASGTSVEAISAPAQSSGPSTATLGGWNSASSSSGEIIVLRLPLFQVRRQ
jgi:hypothetical protein